MYFFLSLQSWNSITGKGCFYLDLDEATPSSQEEDGVIRCHHYRLKLPSPTNVWIEVGVVKPGIPATDVLLFVFHTDENEDPTDLITYTQHKVGEVVKDYSNNNNVVVSNHLCPINVIVDRATYLCTPIDCRMTVSLFSKSLC